MDLLLVGLCTSFLGTDDLMVCSQVLVGQRVAADLILRDFVDFFMDLSLIGLCKS